MKSEPIIIDITFKTEREAKQFCSAWHGLPVIRDAREVVRAELARRRKAKRDAKKAALVVERQGDSYMLKRDWK